MKDAFFEALNMADASAEEAVPYVKQEDRIDEADARKRWPLRYSKKGKTNGASVSHYSAVVVDGFEYKLGDTVTTQVQC